MSPPGESLTKMPLENALNFSENWPQAALTGRQGALPPPAAPQTAAALGPAAGRAVAIAGCALQARRRPAGRTAVRGRFIGWIARGLGLAPRGEL